MHEKQVNEVRRFSLACIVCTNAWLITLKYPGKSQDVTNKLYTWYWQFL